MTNNYLRKINGEYDNIGYPTYKVYYDHTNDQEKYTTISASIGQIQLLINKLEIPVKNKEELLVSCLENEEELATINLIEIKHKLKDSTITIEQLINKTSCHQLLNRLEQEYPQDQVDNRISTLFKDINAGLDYRGNLKRAKKFYFS